MDLKYSTQLSINTMYELLILNIKITQKIYEYLGFLLTLEKVNQVRCVK